MDIGQALSNLFFTPAYASADESYYAQGQKQTKQNEGFRSDPYYDTKGIPTIGYGFNMKAHPEIPSHMTEAQADPYFQNYYKDADAMAMKFAGNRWSGLTDAQKVVLTDMAYNLHDKLFKFKRMREGLMAGNDQQVRDQMQDSDWYNQVGDRGPRNVNNWTMRK